MVDNWHLVMPTIVKSGICDSRLAVRSLVWQFGRISNPHCDRSVSTRLKPVFGLKPNLIEILGVITVYLAKQFR